MEAPRRQPLTPRGLSSQNLKATPAKSLKATPAKGGNAEEVSLDSTRSEYAGKAPAASADAFEMEENNPELAHEQQPARGEAKQHTLSTNNEKSRTLIQMTETQNAVFSQRKADLDAREFQVCATSQCDTHKLCSEPGRGKLSFGGLPTLAAWACPL